MKTIPGRDRGSVSISWAALLALVVSLVVALTSTGLPAAVGRAVESSMCPLLDRRSCTAPPGPTAVAGPRGPDVPGPASDPGEAPVPDAADRTGPPAGAVARPPGPAPGATPPLTRISVPRGPVTPGEEYDAPLNCWEWAQGLCDLGQGLWLGAGDAYNDFSEGVELVACSLALCPPGELEDSWGTWKALVTTNPLDTISAAIDEATRDAGNDWNDGRYWRSIGRVVPTALGAVLGGKGLGKAGSVPAKAPKPKPQAPDLVPDRPPPWLRPGDVPHDATPYRAQVDAAAARAREAAKKGDLDATTQAGMDAFEALGLVEQIARQYPTPRNKSLLARARRAAEQAQRDFNAVQKKSGPPRKDPFHREDVDTPTARLEAQTWAQRTRRAAERGKKDAAERAYLETQLWTLELHSRYSRNPSAENRQALQLAEEALEDARLAIESLE